MNTRWIAVASFVLCAAVLTGAFGAHGLKEKLDAYSMGVYEKAVFYHFVHGLGLLFVGLGIETKILDRALGNRIGSCLACGIILFSGSLYLLAITQISWFGMITPVGGVLFILSWLLLGWSSI